MPPGAPNFASRELFFNYINYMIMAFLVIVGILCYNSL